ncbi:MAG: DUF1987 domain-containing protein [Cytophagales bacterium]
MDKIFLEGTEDTPKILLNADTEIYEISGRSLPEDSAEFYKPVLNWLEAFKSSGVKKCNFEFKLEYFNTASSKLILDVLTKLENCKEAGIDVKIVWYHRDDDEDMQEAGEEFSELVEVPFEFKVY